MTLFIIITLLVIAIRMLYRRYVPVWGVKRINKITCAHRSVLVDVRDFNDVSYPDDSSVVHLPIAYIARQHSIIPKNKVVVIASDRLTCYLSIRELRKYGFSIKGYYCVGKNDNVQFAPQLIQCNN